MKRVLAETLAVPNSAAMQRVARRRLLLAGVLASSCFMAIAVQVTSLAAAGGKSAGMAQASVGIVNNNSKGTAPFAARSALRGDILDRNGNLLATSVPVIKLSANPTEILDAGEAAAKLATVLHGQTEQEILEKLQAKNKDSELHPRLTPRQYEQVMELGIPGLHMRETHARLYPNGRTAAHILGQVDKDGRATAGLEAGMDSKLQAGMPVTLALDAGVQQILTREIQNQINAFDAIGGVGVLMKISTGEIFAITSLPEYDPNHYNAADESAKFNRATKGVYEMGSTFKAINTAMALDSGLFNATDMIDVVSPLAVGRFRIRDYHPESKPLNLAEVMVVSSNIGSARIADRLGAEYQQKYLKKLGLTEPLALEIPETGRPLVPTPWRRTNLMTVSFGHGISVTPVHMTAAMATLLGDGSLVKPSLLKGGRQDPFREIITTPQTSRTLRAIMRQVVKHPRGTANFAETPGYPMAGKTGTAEKTVNGGYNKKANIVSFIGAFPAHQPAYALLIMIDEPKPQKHSHGFATAGWVAAPVAKRFIQQAAPLLGVLPIDEKAPHIRQSLMLEMPELNKKQTDTKTEGAQHAAF